MGSDVTTLVSTREKKSISIEKSLYNRCHKQSHWTKLLLEPVQSHGDTMEMAWFPLVKHINVLPSDIPKSWY